jgi:hypothetical protein
MRETSDSGAAGPRRATVFILSDVRSGSTLLDQCLGAHLDVASLGEIHWLRAYVTEDRSYYDPEHPLVCSCGERVADCAFWNSVQAHLGRPLESLRLRYDIKSRREGTRDEAGAWARVLTRAMRRFPRAFRLDVVRNSLGYAAVARDSVDLYDAVASAAGKRICVDSSKSPFRFRAALEYDPSRTFAIVLVRDYRAVVHSKMKRGQTLEIGAEGWVRKMLDIEALTGDLPSSVVHQVRYEAFCENPARELRAICAILGLEYSPRMQDRQPGAQHHIGGSPSKFDEARRTISMDTSYLTALPSRDVKRLRRLVGPIGRRWGY